MSSLAECKGFYDTCNDGFVKVPANKTGGELIYDLFCPCYKHNAEAYDGFGKAATAVNKVAEHHAVQGINDGTVASRKKPSAASKGGPPQFGKAKATGHSNSNACPMVSSLVDQCRPSFVPSSLALMMAVFASYLTR